MRPIKSDPLNIVTKWSESDDNSPHLSHKPTQNQPNSNWFHTLIRDWKTISLANESCTIIQWCRLPPRPIFGQIWNVNQVEKKVWKVATFLRMEMSMGQGKRSKPTTDTRLFDASLLPNSSEETKTEATTKQITKTLDMEIESEQTQKIIADLCSQSHKVRICLYIFCAESWRSARCVCVWFFFFVSTSSILSR